MESKDIRSDIVLNGKIWKETCESLCNKYFATYYQIFVLATSIGIRHDKREEFSLTQEEKANNVFINIPRTVLHNQISEIDLLFSIAIISTQTEDFTTDERLRIAFGDEESSYKKMKLLEEFANYGIKQIKEQITNNDLQTMENIKNLLEGYLFEDLINEIEIDSNII